MDNNRLKNAIRIVNLAIEEKISVGDASSSVGFSPTYVKNVKIDANKAEKNKKIDLKLLKEFRKRHNEYKEKVLNILNGETKKIKTVYNEKDNFATVEIVGNIKHIKTLNDLLVETRVDLDLWRIKNYTVNKWDSTSWKGKVPQTAQNFQIKVLLERNEEEYKSRVVEDIFEKKLKKYTPPTFTKEESLSFISKNNEENNLFEISMFDLHLGKLAWAGETGENYDTKIAASRFNDAIKTLITRASVHYFNRILFPVGSDFFNTDNLYNTTTKGTPQDEDLRWQKTFDLGVDLLVNAIYLLKKTCVPIDVIVIPGNHDFERSKYMGAYLKAWFRNDDMVNINNGDSPRKYYSFGNVLLGFTHGSEEKESSLPMLMATEKESKNFWSDAKFREWHIGHIHRKRKIDYTILEKNRTLNEEHGVTIRYLSSLTGTEQWHHKKGFVSQIKAADGFIWNDKTGLIVHLNANIIT